VTPACAQDESQKRAAVVAALLLGHQTGHHPPQLDPSVSPTFDEHIRTARAALASSMNHLMRSMTVSMVVSPPSAATAGSLHRSSQVARAESDVQAARNRREQPPPLPFFDRDTFEQVVELGR